MSRLFFIVSLLFAVSRHGFSEETNAVVRNVRNSYESFQIIPERNIFNPNRPNRISKNNRDGEKERPKRVDSFSLVGIMTYEKGTFAFFDSSNSSFKKVAKPSDTIAGYKVSEIDSSGVKLEADGKNLALRVGQQLRREEGGEWRVSEDKANYKSDASSDSSKPGVESSSSANPASTSSGSGGESAIAKRMRERREQELKK